MKKINNFINGQWQNPVSLSYLDKISPRTGQHLLQVADSNELDVIQAIGAGKKAFPEWSTTAPTKRSQYLRLIAQQIEKRRDEFAWAESQDTGKPLALAKTMDIPRSIHNLHFFAERILHKQELCTTMEDGSLNYVVREPLGVVGLITPWNLPLYLLTWKLAPALVTGNTVVCKPSELTPTTTHLLSEVCHEVGLPPGVVNIVHGRGATAGATLASHPGVSAISFTGGTETGEKIQALAGSTFKKVSLELGGKNAVILLKDAPLDKIIPEIIRSSFLNQGEICLCGSKILVQESIYQEFLKRFVEETQKIVVGDPMLDSTFMGALISQHHFEKVQKNIAQALKEGGTQLAGHEPLHLPEPIAQGYFLRPTVITDLSNCSPLHQTEIFGPVVTVNSFKYPHEAIKWANNSPYGLSASLWTQDISKAHKLARDLQVGTVWINCWLKRDLRVPFGGVKHSGVGREGGDYSLDFFTEPKTICIQL
ncbi:MAG: aldehyde dehydrogenase [Bdellovibrionales bacterium]|nr:aldehyde dehydrogenase [Bdellovibrionales bacterium]